MTDAQLLDLAVALAEKTGKDYLWFLENFEGEEMQGLLAMPKAKLNKMIRALA